MVGHCGQLKEEYSRLACVTAGRVPASFFASKANVIGEILKIMETTYQKREKELQETITECKWVPVDLVPIIAQYVPL